MILKPFDISIIVCTGSPRRKHDVLSTCFQKLGFSIGMHIQPNPETIDLLLLEDLGHSLGILPNRWMESDASLRAREKINKFISQTAMLTGKRLLLDVNPLTLPLWIDVFQSHGIQLKFIHILRHPYEVALSLQDNQNLELQQGHILWLSYTYSAMDALKGQDCFFITVDQLLADPVATCNHALTSLLTSDFIPLTYDDILEDVQPATKKHHVYDLSDADQLIFKHYTNLYYQIRSTYQSLSEKSNGNHQLKVFGASEIDLIDSLLRAFAGLTGQCLDNHGSLSVGSNHLLYGNLLHSVPNAFVIHDQLISVLKTMTSMGGFQQKYKNKSEEFKKISTENNKSFIKAKTFWGAHIHLLPQNEVVSSMIYSFGLFEPELCSFFTDYLFQGAIVLDVGAHIGLFSMLSSELTGDTGKVFAFEPTPSTREILQLNINPYKQANIVPKLVWHKETELDFHDFGIEFSAYNTATSDRLSPENKRRAKDTLIKVAAVTLDIFCQEQEIRPNLIKIDAESSEMEVLKGMTTLLDSVRPIVTIEVGDMESTLKDGIPRSFEILKFAMSYDYIPIRPVAGRYEHHEIKDHYDYDNIIMVPKEKLPVRRPLGAVVVQRGRFY